MKKKSLKAPIVQPVTKPFTPAEQVVYLNKALRSRCERVIAYAKEQLPEWQKRQAQDFARGMFLNNNLEVNEALARNAVAKSVLRDLDAGVTIFEINATAMKNIYSVASWGSRSTDPYEAIMERHRMEAWSYVVEAFQFAGFNQLKFDIENPNAETLGDVINANS